MSLPLVSVIIAARDAAGTLGACLASLAALDYPAVEIVVVDDGSRDDTAAIARASGARVIENTGSGPSAARNQGLGVARGDLVAFTDADCSVPQHWLKTLVEALTATGAAGAGGGQHNVVAGTGTAATGLDAFFRAASIVSDYTQRHGAQRDVSHIAACNALYRKQPLVEAGGFREGLFPGEDVDLDYRLRRQEHRLTYVPGADVEHVRPDNLAWFARWMRRYGASQRELVRLHGRFRAIHYVPLVTVGMLAAQALWLWPAMRTVIAVCDLGAAVAAATLVVRSGPPREWPAIVRYGAIALIEWHWGYFASRSASRQ